MCALSNSISRDKELRFLTVNNFFLFFFRCKIICLCVGYVKDFAVQIFLGARRCWVPLELQLQMAVSCSLWVLGSKLGSSERAFNR